MHKQGLGVSLLRDVLGCRPLNAAVESMEIRGRILVTIAFIRVRLHWSEARNGIPEIVGALNFLGVISNSSIPCIQKTP